MGLLLIIGRLFMTGFGLFGNILTKLPLNTILIASMVVAVLFLVYNKGSSNNELAEIKADRAKLEEYVENKRKIGNLSDADLDDRLRVYQRD